MNLYKLHNVGRKHIRLSPGDTLIRKKYSVGYLKELAEKYEMREFLEYSYCCRGEDHNCWVEVEGIDYGWMFLDHEEAEMPKVLFDRALSVLKSHRDALYKRKLFVFEDEKRIIVYAFLRDVCRNDFILTFAKYPEAEEVGLFS